MLMVVTRNCTAASPTFHHTDVVRKTPAIVISLIVKCLHSNKAKIVIRIWKREAAPVNHSTPLLYEQATELGAVRGGDARMFMHEIRSAGQ